MIGTTGESSTGFHWIEIVVVFAVWAAVVFIQNIDDTDETGAGLYVAITGLAWAFATFPILTLARKYPLTREQIVARVLLFTFLGFLVAFLMDTVAELASDAFRENRPEGILETLDYQLRRELFDFQSDEMMAYALILGIGLLRGAHGRIRAEQVRGSELQARLSEARLTALRAQLNPHFFFNTLNTVSDFVESDPQRARVVIARLGDLMRAALADTEVQEVPLRDEVALLDAYFDVVEARFGERLQVHQDIDASCLEAMVPQLILQPVVENSVKHGLEETRGLGRIWVRARRFGERLLLEVADSGPGFEPGSVEEGIGLRSVRERLQQLYGRNHDWRVSGREGGGAVVRIEIPFRTASEVRPLE